MSMNVNAIKQRLASLQSRGRTGNERSKLTEVVWKAPIGKSQIRMLPARWDKENPFREVFLHYGIGDKTRISLINYGEKDPIVEFSQNLRKQTYTQESYKLSKKLEPKMRVFAPVIVRGEEDKGVRLWEFGKEVYMELLAIAEDEDIGDYTDTYQGRDLTVETVGPDQSGRQFNKTSVRVKAKQTPTTDNAQLLSSWLENQPDPLELYNKPSYEELKQMLYSYLNPETESSESTPPPPQNSTPAAEQPATQPAAAPVSARYSLNTKQTPDLDKEFADLFAKKAPAEPEDDLPF